MEGLVLRWCWGSYVSEFLDCFRGDFVNLLVFCDEFGGGEDAVYRDLRNVEEIFGSLGEGFVHPCVDAFAGFCCGEVELAMPIGGRTEGKFTGEGFVGFLPLFLAKFKVVIYGVLKGLFGFGDSCACEGDDVADVEDATEDDSGFVVNFHVTDVSFVVQHG